MKVNLLYGKTGLEVNIPSDNVTIIESQDKAGCADEKAEFIKSLRNPIDSAPLKELISSTETLAVVIPDITRPLPSDRILPWLFEELSHVPKENIVIINGTGSHRENDRDELISMVGEEIVDQYKIVNHNSHDKKTMTQVGTKRGIDIYMNSDYVKADKKILIGFIEPHFMAGYSGGYKAVFPGIADIDALMYYHGATVIGDPRSTWGNLDANPTQDTVREFGSAVSADFLINVTLNIKKELTAFYCGDIIKAHDFGCSEVKKHAMVPFQQDFPIVITTNNGYPLDQNLYQTVKGMSAARMIVQKDGLIISASECSDGFPEHGNFKGLLFDYETPEKMLEAINTPGFSMFDQWEAQILGMLRQQARIALYSTLDDEDVRRAHLEPVHDIEALINSELDRIGRDAPIAVLPEGFAAVPYLT